MWETLRTILAIISPVFAAGICYAILKMTEKGMERLSNDYNNYKTVVIPQKIGDCYEYINNKTDAISNKLDSVAQDVAFIRGKLNGLLK